MNTDLTLYPFLDETDLRIPTPSTLNNIEPIGIGTGVVESLTSYIGRLADAHTTSVSMLLKYEFSNHFKHNYLDPDQTTGSSYNALNAMNGRCSFAATWVEVLEKMTLRDDLKYLTFLSYREMLGDKSLLKRHRHWCPECFHEWRKQGCICYEPLIWKALPVLVCPTHSSKLRMSCPHCGHFGPDLEPRYTPGHCSKCLKWLGDGTEFRMNGEHNFEWYLEHSLKVAELLAVAPRLDHVPNSDNITSLFQYLVTKRARGCRALGRLLRCGHDNVVNWLNGKYQPNFQVFIKLLVMFRIDPAEVISQQPCFICDKKVSDIHSEQEKATVKHQERIDWVAVEDLMTAMVEGRIPPLPILELAKRVGCSATSLYKKCPNLCGSVSIKYYEAKQEQRRQYLSDIHNQVSSLICADGAITKKEVYKAIGGKGRAKRDVVRDAFL